MISALMSVYTKEKAEYLDKAIASMVNQTIKPTEFVIIKDGLLTQELESVLEQYSKKHPDLFKIIGLKENVGLGKALEIGILQCSQEFVARMDSDDIAMPERLKKQLSEFIKNPDLALVGSYITEFDDCNDKNFIRKVPLSHEDILQYAKKRNPFNHMTVMFRKQTVLNAGNYQPFLWFEDYFLWVRMILENFKMLNISESLVYVRTGKNMFERRGGFKYTLNEVRLQREFLKMGFINEYECIYNIVIRSFVRLLPNKLRGYVYRRFLRK